MDRSARDRPGPDTAEQCSGVQWSTAEQFAQISEDLLAESGRDTTLDRIVQLAVQTIPAADACGITIRRGDDTLETPAYTTPMIKELDELQYALREGPCWDATWVMNTRAISDMRAEQRYPRWTPAAVRAGIESVLSVRVATATKLVGGLNLYAGHVDAFDETDAITASIFARHAANALGVADRATNLQTALLTRQAIGTAQGMLMQRYGLDLDQSFELLRRYSQDHNIKLRDLAERLVRSGGITNTLEEALELPSPTPP